MARRRPKLLRVVNDALAPWDEASPDAVIDAIEEAGYTIIDTATLHRERVQAQNREAQLAHATRDQQNTLAWGQELARRERAMADRVSFLYLKAIEAGATPADLRQP